VQAEPLDPDGDAWPGPVDSALRSLANREFLTGREVRAIFAGLRVSVPPNAAPSIGRVLDGALASAQGDQLWGTATVADTLLDLRLLAAVELTTEPATRGAGTRVAAQNQAG